MMTRSDADAAVQTLLLVLFNAVFILGPGALLFRIGIAFKARTLICGARVLLAR